MNKSHPAEALLLMLIFAPYVLMLIKGIGNSIVTTIEVVNMCKDTTTED